MHLSSKLLQLALVIPAAAILSEPVFAGPCGRVSETTGYSTINASTQAAQDLRGFIGIVISELTPSRAASINSQNYFSNPVPAVNGVLVGRVLSDGPAGQAGLQPGDVLLGVNGQMVTTVSQVQQIIGSTPVNEIIPLTFQRGQQVQTVRISIGDGNVLRTRM